MISSYVLWKIVFNNTKTDCSFTYNTHFYKNSKTIIKKMVKNQCVVQKYSMKYCIQIIIHLYLNYKN